MGALNWTIVLVLTGTLPEIEPSTKNLIDTASLHLFRAIRPIVVNNSCQRPHHFPQCGNRDRMPKLVPWGWFAQHLHHELEARVVALGKLTG